MVKYVSRLLVGILLIASGIATGIWIAFQGIVLGDPSPGLNLTENVPDHSDFMHVDMLESAWYMMGVPAYAYIILAGILLGVAICVYGLYAWHEPRNDAALG